MAQTTLIKIGKQHCWPCHNEETINLFIIWHPAWIPHEHLQVSQITVIRLIWTQQKTSRTGDKHRQMTTCNATRSHSFSNMRISSSCTEQKSPKYTTAIPPSGLTPWTITQTVSSQRYWFLFSFLFRIFFSVFSRLSWLAVSYWAHASRPYHILVLMWNDTDSIYNVHLPL